MTDLNSWQLAYLDTVLTFGNLATDFPFSAQVEISEPDATLEDSPHPTSDGVVMGMDSLGGMELIFNLTTIPEFPIPAKPWHGALDLVSTFKSKWRADAIRRTAGTYATLTNLDRNRMVYGRPRKFVPKFTRLRKGLAEYVATFETNSPDFYSATEKTVNLNPAPAPAGGGIHSPIVAPIATITGTSASDVDGNAGDVATWPVIEFHGPSSAQSVELLDGATVVWVVKIPGQLKFDEVLTVDTRPWARSATINGLPANGRLRGTALERCSIPVGDFEFRYKVNDPTGTAFADVKWRDAYASL